VQLLRIGARGQRVEFAFDLCMAEFGAAPERSQSLARALQLGSGIGQFQPGVGLLDPGARLVDRRDLASRHAARGRVGAARRELGRSARELHAFLRH